VRNGCHIRNHVDADAQRGKRTNRRLATRAWAFDFNIQIFNALLHCCTSSHFGGHLSRKRGGFTGSLESLTTRRGPGKRVSLTICDGNDRVIERRVNMCHAIRNVFANFFAHSLCSSTCRSFCHFAFSVPVISSTRRRPCVDPCGYAHWYGFFDHASADLCDDGTPDSNQCPSNA
jgi:hypothetical protein